MTVQGAEIPVTISYEKRTDIRFSFARSGAFMRIPHYIPKSELDKHWKRFQEWVAKTYLTNERIHQQFNRRIYEDGSTLEVGDYTYLIRIERTNAKSHKAKIKGNTIYLALSVIDEGFHLQKNIRHLLSRCIANHRLPDITERVHFWNDRYYQKTINKVSFKLNQSNWGSCSTKSNINLSTRLLFAPNEVIDYVIVHELAHLIEMNHSSRFWKIVADVMPDYQQKEKWLDKNGHLCNW